MTFLVALACGALVGLCLGALGGGGSILIAPALLLGLHLDPVQATFAAKVVVGATSLVAATLYWRYDAFDLRAAIMMAASGLLPALLGSYLAPHLPAMAMIVALASVMFAAAAATYRRANLSQRNGKYEESVANSESNDGEHHSLGRLVTVGICVGFFTGLLGVGCGFLIVPTLLVIGLPMRTAVGTSLVVICVNSAVACLGGGGGGLPIELLLLFAAAVLACPAGVYLASRISTSTLQHSFAILVAIAGIALVWHAIATLA